MSYIRASTEVPGQKNLSRTYAWHDIAGGIRISSRGNSPKADHPLIVISIPEFHYMASSFLRQFNSWYKKKGESDEAALRRMHRGFYERFDEKFEIAHKKSMKKWTAQMKKDQERQKKFLKRTFGVLRNKKRDDENFRKMIEEEATRLLIKEEAMKRKKR